MDKLFITIGGAGLIVFIYWFFFGKKTSYTPAVVSPGPSGAKGATIDIVVDGGYKPSAIKLEKGKKTTLSIVRKDPNSCLEEIIIPDFKISRYLPLNKNVEIDITPEKAGEFTFHCGMNMFHGKLVVD